MSGPYSDLRQPTLIYLLPYKSHYYDIDTRFSINYKNRVWKHEVMLKKSERSQEGQNHQINGVTISNGGKYRNDSFEMLFFIFYLVQDNAIVNVAPFDGNLKNKITPIG